MDKDRRVICKIVSDMLDNPDESGIYPTSTAFARLEHYVEQQRHEAIGWAHAEACILLDRGIDPRVVAVPDLLERGLRDLDPLSSGHSCSTVADETLDPLLISDQEGAGPTPDYPHPGRPSVTARGGG